MPKSPLAYGRLHHVRQARNIVLVVVVRYVDRLRNFRLFDNVFEPGEEPIDLWPRAGAVEDVRARYAMASAYWILRFAS